MKRTSRACAVFLLISLLVNPCLAQQAASVAELKSQIQAMIEVERNPETPDEVKALNRGFLRERLAQLQAGLRKRVEALRKYQATVGPSLNAEEAQAVEGMLKDLERDVEEVAKNMREFAPGATAPAREAVAATPAARPRVTEVASVTPGVPGGAPVEAAPPAAAPPRRETAAASAPALIQGTCYDDAPPLVVSNVDRVVDDVVRRRASDPFDALFPDIFFYAVADAVTRNESVSIRALDAYRYMGETARTDKQMGTSARSEGTTTATEKPGFADLLSWAVEHGAIQQAVNSTTLTLSTTPYAFVAATEGDTPETYEKYEFFRRIGISANFNISDQDSPLANATRRQLTEWSVRVRLHGDRSTRGAAFREFWRNNIRRRVQQRLVAVVRSSRVLDEDESVRRLRDRVEDQIRGRLDAVAQPARANNTDLDRAAVRNIIMCGLRDEVVNALQTDAGLAANISGSTITAIRSDLVPSLFAAHEDLERARDELSRFLEDLGRRPTTTFAYSNHRTGIGSDYSNLRFLHERKTFSPLKLVANAGLSFYHRPDRALNQQNVRDLAFALSFEGEMQSPFTTNELDMSKITYSFSGRYQRMFENRHTAGRKADIAVAQFRMEVPLFTGASIPFSFSYANATELIKEDHVRANFGFSFDADKLFALTKLRR